MPERCQSNPFACFDTLSSWLVQRWCFSTRAVTIIIPSHIRTYTEDMGPKFPSNQASRGPFHGNKWLCHLLNGLFFIISTRKKLNVVCFIPWKSKNVFCYQDSNVFPGAQLDLLTHLSIAFTIYKTDDLLNHLVKIPSLVLKTVTCQPRPFFGVFFKEQSSFYST